MTFDLLTKLQGILFHPRIRLENDFPLTGKQLGKVYGKALGYFVLGSALPPLLLVGYMFAIMLLPAEQMLAMLKPLDRYLHDGQVDIALIVVLTVVSFLLGSSLELMVLSRALHAKGKKLTQAVALNLDSLRGRTGWHTAWNLIWRVLVAIVVWNLLELVLGWVLPQVHQDALDISRQVAGGNLLVWFLIAAVAGPITEEVVFRGFLFSSLRCSFQEGRIGRWLGQGRFSDLAAIVVSSLVFALIHFQFNAVIIMLFLGGCFAAETYRRTGTLWTGILFHAFNNGFAVLYMAHMAHNV